jgi:hypothetical protein
MAAGSSMRDDPGCVVYLKGQSQGVWLPGAGREDFVEYCVYVERIIRQHGARRVVWDGDPPEAHAFAERFPELFCRLSALTVQDAAGGEARPLLDEIKAYRLKGCTQELQAEILKSQCLSPNPA